MRRAAAVTAGVAALLLAPATPALADAAGPTDYQTRLVSIDPEVAGLRITVIGGDSFVGLAADPGLTVEVIGYRGEPYLRFLPDGTVERNERSPSTYLSEDRYADVALPPEADPDAEPVWEIVATDGSYAWHDHRTHWMNEARPPGREPGDLILEGVVPLVVDGVAVDVTMDSVWEPRPSVLPVVFGGVAGALLVAASVRVRSLVVPTGALAAVGLVLGLGAFLSVPAETGPSPVMWAVPGVGLAVAVAAGAASRRSPSLRSALVLVVAAELVVWGALRWGWLWSAVIPTSLPFWIDRAGTALVLGGSLGVGSVAARKALRPGAP
jgi:hypothetical protein